MVDLVLVVTDHDAMDLLKNPAEHLPLMRESKA